jgi:uncharacterized OB-fold protein
MEIPRHWRLKAQRYRLEGSVCPNCGQTMFPPRPLCGTCQSTNRLAQGMVFEPLIILNTRVDTIRPERTR